MMHKRLLIGSSLALLALIFGLTLEQKFSKPAATVLAAERDTTTPTLAPVDSCSFGGVQITAIEHTRNLVDDKVEVGWNYTVPPQLAALGTCVAVDEFIVYVKVIYENGGSREKYQKASGLSRNEVVRFGDLVRKVKRIEATVSVEYKIHAEFTAHLEKNL
jgi:hypothetical protein